MLKNITFSADENLIARARERAESEDTTLNNEFRRWLAKYAEQIRDGEEFDELMNRLHYVRAGRKYSRDEMNER
jgi:hypothetical protein